MTVNHDAVSALPIAGSASKTLVRNVLVARMPYVLADGDDSRNLIAIDPATGARIVDMLLFGRVFHYDASDATTAHDGATCLVSADGLRYKLAVGTDVFAYAVLDNTIATPPISPSLGDAYLVAAGSTGAWAGKSNFIAVKTSRGWEFVNFSIGRFIYVESVDTYYHKNAGGSWVTGFGNQVTTPNSVPLSAAINFGKRLIVENQTTTSPPVSPIVGTAYIIGPSATGAWAGLDGKIAICEVAGSFVIYTPTNGWSAYDKAKNSSLIFNGSSWEASAGAWSKLFSVITDASGGTPNTGTNYAYDPSTAPTTSARHIRDDVQLPGVAAGFVGQRIRFAYQASAVMSIGSTGYSGIVMAYGLFRDSEATAIEWAIGPLPQIWGNGFSGTVPIATEFLITASDALAHDYFIRIFYGLSSGTNFTLISSLGRRRFTAELASS